MFHPIPPPRRPGLVSGCLLLLATLSLQAAPDPLPPAMLDESRVVISYADLRQLIERASPPPPQPPPSPPVAACLVEARHHLRFEAEQPVFEAAFTVENLSASWASIALGESAGMLPLGTLPEGLRLARQHERLLLILEKAGRVACQLQLLPSVAGAYELTVPAEAAFASLQIDAPPSTQAVQITWPDGSQSRHEQALLLGLHPAQTPLRVAVVDREGGPPAHAHALDAALIGEASFQTQIARDGAQLTQVSLRIEHRAAATLSLRLPPNAELLRGTLKGQPLPAGIASAGEALSIPLPPPNDPEKNTTEVSLAYFAQGAALHPSEGEFDLELPHSPLLMRRLDWSIELPEGLELSARGNAEAQPSPAPQRHVLHLARQLCRDSATQVRVTYRHPQNPAKP